MTKKAKQFRVSPHGNEDEFTGITQKHAHQIYNKAFSSVKASHDFYCEMALECAKRGLIKITDKQKRSYKGSTYSTSSGISNFILTNKSATSGKPMSFVTCNDHHAPLNEVSDSSHKLQKREFELRLANKYVETVYGDKLKAYLLTLTVPNCRKGQLLSVTKKFAKNVSAFLTALKDAQTRDGSFNLGVEFFGALTGFEITINSDALENQSSDNLFHPHAHILLLTSSGEMDIDAVTDMLFDYWQAKNKGFNLSKDAFLLEPTYDIEKDKSLVESTLQGGIEATKYITKPDAWGRLEKQQNDKTKSSDYTYEIFAELYNVNRGFKANRTMGLMNKAVHFGKLIQLLSNSIDFTSDDDDAITPDIVTHLSQVGYNRQSKRLYSKHERDLTYAEILYFNRDIVKGLFTNLNVTNFDPDAWINRWGNDEQGKKISAEVATIFNNTRYDLRGWVKVMQSLNIKHSIDDVIAKLRTDIDAVDSRKLDWEDKINEVEEAIAASGHSDSAPFGMYRRLQVFEEKKSELRKLIDVLMWASTYKTRDLNTGQVTKTSPVNYDGIILDAKSFNISELDVRNIDVITMFGRKFSGKVLGKLIKYARNGFDLPQMPEDVNVSQQIAIYRKMSVLSGIVNETAYRSGIRTARKSDAQLAMLVDMVAFSESSNFKDDFSFADFKSRFADVISEFKMTEKQAKMWSVAMYNYLGIINSDNLDVDSISNIPAPVVYFGMDLSETDFFNMLMGRAKSYKPIRTQYISAIA